MHACICQHALNPNRLILFSLAGSSIVLLLVQPTFHTNVKIAMKHARGVVQALPTLEMQIKQQSR